MSFALRTWGRLFLMTALLLLALLLLQEVLLPTPRLSASMAIVLEAIQNALLISPLFMPLIGHTVPGRSMQPSHALAVTVLWSVAHAVILQLAFRVAWPVAGSNAAEAWLRPIQGPQDWTPFAIGLTAGPLYVIGLFTGTRRTAVAVGWATGLAWLGWLWLLDDHTLQGFRDLPWLPGIIGLGIPPLLVAIATKAFLHAFEATSREGVV